MRHEVAHVVKIQSRARVVGVQRQRVAQINLRVGGGANRIRLVAAPERFVNRALSLFSSVSHERLLLRARFLEEKRPDERGVELLDVAVADVEQTTRPRNQSIPRDPLLRDRLLRTRRTLLLRAAFFRGKKILTHVRGFIQHFILGVLAVHRRRRLFDALQLDAIRVGLGEVEAAEVVAALEPRHVRLELTFKPLVRDAQLLKHVAPLVEKKHILRSRPSGHLAVRFQPRARDAPHRARRERVRGPALRRGEGKVVKRHEHVARPVTEKRLVHEPLSVDVRHARHDRALPWREVQRVVRSARGVEVVVQ